jgi:hypothetical protein
MKKVIRLTESDLTRIVRRVIKEQSQISTQQWKSQAENLFRKMKGMNTPSDAKKIEEYITLNIKNKQDWENLKKAFGVRDGENLDQWLQGETWINYNKLMTIINNNQSKYESDDKKYNPGTKIPLITNREFIVGRSYNYSDTMGDDVEMELDIRNSTIVKRTSNGIVVNVPYLEYYSKYERKMGGDLPKKERLQNVCLMIDFKDITGWNQGTLQIAWFSDWPKNKIVPCK